MGQKSENRFATIADVLADVDAVEEALNRATEQAIWRHERLGEDYVIWREGYIVIVHNDGRPEEIIPHKPNRSA